MNELSVVLFVHFKFYVTKIAKNNNVDYHSLSNISKTRL